jgi:hypothetical protein
METIDLDCGQLLHEVVVQAAASGFPIAGLQRPP